MEAISVKFEENFLGDMDKTMKRHRYMTRTEFIREAIRDKMRDLEKEEALILLKKNFGASKKKTTYKEERKAREVVGRKYAEKFGIKLD